MKAQVIGNKISSIPQGDSAQYLRRQKKLGSILLEVLLSVAILSISITLIIQSMMTSLRATVASNEYTTALSLLENKMSDLIAKGTIAAGLSQEGNLPAPYQQYQYSLKTQKLDDRNQKNINKVHLQISWLSGQNKRKIVLETYLLALTEQTKVSELQ